MTKQMELSFPASAPGAAHTHALTQFDGLRWPEVERHFIKLPKVHVWLISLNEINLAQEPGGGWWALGMTMSWSGGGRAWAAFPRWGAFSTRAEALASARNELEKSLGGKKKQQDRIILKAWRVLLTDLGKAGA